MQMAKLEIDPNHSSVEVIARHMMVATVRARFKILSGTIEFDPDDMHRSGVEAIIDAKSVDTGVPDRDAHLRSADFLEADQFPFITFRSTRVERGDARRAMVYGDLTIREVTREVGLGVKFTGRSVSPYGYDVLAFSATATIDRRQFGITWNQPLAEMGGVLVSNDLRIDIDVEAKAVAPEAEPEEYEEIEEVGELEELERLEEEAPSA
jgi:polyisoprenoid-binding protein YceI